MYLTDDEKKALQQVLVSEENESPLLRAITKLLAEHPAESGNEVDFGAKVPESLYNEFKQLYPQYGATKWFINAALSSFLLRVRRDHEVAHLVSRSVGGIRLPAEF